MLLVDCVGHYVNDTAVSVFLFYAFSVDPLPSKQSLTFNVKGTPTECVRCHPVNLACQKHSDMLFDLEK